MSGALASAIRQLVAEDLASGEASLLTGDDRREFARQQIFSHLDALVDEGAHGWAPRGPDDEQGLAQSVLDALFGLGRLQELVDNPEIENIDINGCDRVWATFADGSKRLMPAIAESDEELIDTVRSAASRFGLSERRFDLARPELDLRLPDGSRLSALMAVTARPSVSIRRHRFSDLSLEDLTRLGTVDRDLASLLGAAVRARKNIVVSGAMNSGKTTLLRALAAEVGPRERIVTIEQALELGLHAAPDRHPDMVALEARPANVEGEGLISVADLVRRALRMNADRVIVGEVLGDEVLPMLNAMSQGRSGSMCTIHSDSSAGVFRRIASYAVQAPERLPLEASNLLIAGAIHFVVHLDSETIQDHRASGLAFDASGHPSDEAAVPCHFPSAPNRQRFVSSVREVVDAEGVQVISNEIFRPGSDRRAVAASPIRPETVRELRLFGYEPSTSDAFGMLV
ncbi:MAG: CpaF family protein [Acidimicrobiales bacterium]|nr:CpaF family protein [Acidimicrobiales bacterium]